MCVIDHFSREKTVRVKATAAHKSHNFSTTQFSAHVRCLCVFQGMMGVVGWILLLLSQMMVPVASQKPPGLNVGVIMGQTRPVSDQEFQPTRRPDDALDISVVALRINETDPKSVITQVRNAYTHKHTL